MELMSSIAASVTFNILSFKVSVLSLLYCEVFNGDVLGKTKPMDKFCWLWYKLPR